MGKRNFHEIMKNVFEPTSDTFKQTAHGTTGGVKDTTKANKLNGEGEIKQITKQQTY